MRGAWHGGATAAHHAPVRWPLLLTGAGWFAGAAVVLLAVGSSVDPGMRTPSGHLLLNTVNSCVALLLAYLLAGRVQRRRHLQDLWLAEVFVVLACAGLLTDLAPALSRSADGSPAVVWSALLMRVAAGALVLAAALAGPHRCLTSRARVFAVAPLAALSACLLVLWLLRDALPMAVEVGPADGGLPNVDEHLLLLLGHSAGAVCFAVASCLFTRQALRDHDELVLWLGPGCALAAGARVCYALYPSLYTDWVSAGDALRSASYAVLLIGAAREIGDYWHGWAGAAVLEDRRRLARELHDGVVQEVSYLRGAALTAVPDDAARDDIVSACDRALDEARAAVDVLGRSPDEPLAMALHRAAQQVAERYGGRIVVDLDDSLRADQDRRHALVRITREAVSNALRHGSPQQVCLRLEQDGDACRLVVEDDGRGFTPAAGGPRVAGGYGLTSMRDRASALPGDLTIKSTPGSGTTVQVTWPACPDGSAPDQVRARNEEALR